MSMQGGVMTMRELKDGLAIPAHGAVSSAPSGYHLMFTGLKGQLVEGRSVKVTLTFAKADPSRSNSRSRASARRRLPTG